MRKTVYLLLSIILLLISEEANAVYRSVGFTNVPSGFTNYTTLTTALSVAVSGDIVWVAAGTYAESELIVPVGVVVIGGFPSNSKTNSDRVYPGMNKTLTILDGSASHRVATVRGTLDGFIIRNGKTTGNGAGVLIDGGTVQSCIIKGNQAWNTNITTPSRGGGAYLQNGGTLINSVVAFNMASDGYGVAGANGTLVNNTITSNTNAPVFIKIPAGSFAAGDLTDGAATNVTLSEYSIAQTETTNAQYAVFAAALGFGSTPTYTFTTESATACHFTAATYPIFATSSGTSTDWGLNYVDGNWASVSGKENFPMVWVNWYGSLAYSIWLGGTLPTRAQWEYAARKTNIGYSNTTYAGSATANDVDWFSSNSGGSTKPVAIKLGNGINVYDMCGNAYEWSRDWDSSTYPSSATDPTGPLSGANRVVLGGSWESTTPCSVVFHNAGQPTAANGGYGFRPIIVP
ncbi:SUMF1/EgtB/PvdO family nonheme iron enzyme [uncultured Bacteroides sp.]|uniref:formylglycine-generating enzyme family protein n=1 Tax=uncultured Bacteroides sp. TaxID=162156 RepID=UPI002AAA8F2D|nr:SUMF1/EgtB/PvdO family nonheme iron enzyme [uncultured Bacteroides sp.]